MKLYGIVMINFINITKNIQSVLEKVIKYSIIGGLGTIVNEGVLLSLKPYIPVSVALALAIEISILFNFVLNDIWTFKERRVGNFIKRMYKFHVAAIVGGAIQYVVVIGLIILLIHYSNLTSLLFLLFFSTLHISSIYLAMVNFMGIIAGFGVRFILSIKYVWA